LNIMVSVSQWEREAIGERTRDAMRHKRANGERVGTVPFGYRLGADGRALEAEAVEQQTLEAIKALRASGVSLRGVASELNRRGIQTRAGTSWRFEYIRSLVRQATSLVAA